MRRVLLFFGVSILLLPSCRKSAETTYPVRETITESVYASGLIRSKGQYQVFAPVNGLLQEVFVEDGDTVRQGEPLFSIQNDASTLTRENAQLAAQLADVKANQNRLDDLRLSIDIARSRMVNDSILLVRQKSLWNQQIGSRVELERAELNYENTRTALASARLKYADEKRRLDLLYRQALKHLEITRTSESDYTIRSNIHGRVYDVMTEAGEMVTPQTPLAIIGDASSFILELEVDEYDITRIQPGQTVMVTMDSYSGQVFEATVTRINPIIHPRTKTSTVEAVFTTAPARLYPNLTFEANIILRIKEKALTIPRPYLVNDDRVILASGDTVRVTTGLRDYQKAEILSGLSETDMIRRPVP